MPDTSLHGQSVRKFRAIVQAAGLSHEHDPKKTIIDQRALEAPQPPKAGKAGAQADTRQKILVHTAEMGSKWRKYRVAPLFDVPLLTEPRAHAHCSARLGPGRLLLTTGKWEGQFLEVMLVMSRVAWVPLLLADGREVLLPIQEAGKHGDEQEQSGGLQATLRQHRLAMLRLELAQELLVQELLRAEGRLPWPQGGEELIEHDGRRAFLFGPDDRSFGVTPGEPLPLLVVMHDANKRGSSLHQGWDFDSWVEEEYRTRRRAARQNILMLIPEAGDHTWDFITVSGREDMDFLEYAIMQVCSRYTVDRKRIAVAGESDGGSMALTLALRNPDVFVAGLAQAAGFILMDPALVPAGTKPRLFMEYGTKDELGFYGNARSYLATWAGAGYEVRFRAIEAGGHMASPHFFHDAVRFWQSPPVRLLPKEEACCADAVERDWQKGRLNPYSLEAVANFRDVAGVDPTLRLCVRGGMLRRGVLFRSGLWNLATEADVAVLRDKLKIKTFLDLRQGLGDQALDGSIWDAYPPSPCGRHGELPARAKGELRRVHCDLEGNLADRDYVSSVDLARGRPASASSMRSANCAAGCTVDGQPLTRWISACEDGQWLCVDLGMPFALARVDVHWEKACASAYRVQGRLDETCAWEDISPVQTGREGWVSTELWRGSLARFVRLQCEKRALAEFGFSISDLHIRPAASADLALGRPATASSENKAERSASCAVDGWQDTRWSSSYEDGQWLCVDLGADMPIGHVGIEWEKACAKSYLLQGSSDGRCWVTLAEEQGREGWVATSLAKGCRARYVRMLGRTRATEWGFSIYHLKVYGSEAVETVDLAYLRPVEASSSKKLERVGERAVDGDPSTRWHSDSADNQWLSVDLGLVRKLARVELLWEKACARRYLLQGSTDGVDWVTLAEEEGHEGWVVTLLPAGSKARYVRMYGQTRAMKSYGCGFSIFHFKVYGGDGFAEASEKARLWRRAALEKIASPQDYFYVHARSLLQLRGEVLAEALRTLAEPENYPLAFGCMQGKDRTGLLSLLVLAALGASEADIVDDYLMSNEACEHNAECSRANCKKYEQLERARSRPGGEAVLAMSGGSEEAGKRVLPPEPQEPSTSGPDPGESQSMLVYQEVAERILTLLRQTGGVLSYLESIGFGPEEVERLRALLVVPCPA